MLDPEYVRRIDREMEESGGQLAPDDHEGVWGNLKSCDEWRAELEFAIALLTDMTLDEVREMTLNEAAERHPTLSREEALKAEIQTRDSLLRAVETRSLRDKIARMQRGPATLIDLFGDEEAEDLDVGGDEDDPCGCESDREAKAIRCNSSLGERLRSGCERERQVAAARNAARLARARYDGGVVDYLEALDSERSLFTAELEESSARQQSLTAVVLLYKPLGGGWIPEEEDWEEYQWE